MRDSISSVFLTFSKVTTREDSYLDSSSYSGFSPIQALTWSSRDPPAKGKRTISSGSVPIRGFPWFEFVGFINFPTFRFAGRTPALTITRNNTYFAIKVKPSGARKSNYLSLNQRQGQLNTHYKSIFIAFAILLTSTCGLLFYLFYDQAKNAAITKLNEEQ